ncbi:hypothetical protein HHI36_008513 [Cryptolaemus montrouzieri]|uniref:Uncharacterized protein n=1 Tax=Cryptolaemus montrouzieri TaxID=559131 RepID=A0ABD2MST6_9CUCU
MNHSTFVHNATDPMKKEIYRRKLEPKGDKFIMTLNEGVEKMRTEFFAFHTEQTSAYKVVADTFQESEKCKLQEIQFVNLVEPWIIATKNHTYKELLKISLSHLREAGFYNAERKRIFKEKPKCTSKTSSFVSAGIIDIYAAFLFFAVGLLISFGLFLTELLIKKYSQRRLKKNWNKFIIKKFER